MAELFLRFNIQLRQGISHAPRGILDGLEIDIEVLHVFIPHKDEVMP